MLRVIKILYVFILILLTVSSAPASAQSGAVVQDKIGEQAFGVWSGLGRTCRRFPNGFWLELHLFRGDANAATTVGSQRRAGGGVGGVTGQATVILRYRNYTSTGQEAVFSAAIAVAGQALVLSPDKEYANPERHPQASFRLINDGMIDQGRQARLTVLARMPGCETELRLQRRGNEQSARRQVARLLGDAGVKATRPDQPQLSARQIQSLGDLSGKWYGVAFCENRRAVDMEMEISSLGRDRFKSRSAIKGRTRTIVANEVIQLPTQRHRSGVYDVVDASTGKTGRSPAAIYSISSIFNVDGKPQYIELRLSGKCRAALLGRFDKPPELGGGYVTWTTPDARCQGFVSWIRKRRENRQAVEQLKQDFPELLRDANFERAADTYIYSGEQFRTAFGTSFSQLSAGTRARLFHQMAECIVLRDERSAVNAASIGEYVLTGENRRLLWSMYHPQTAERNRSRVVPLRTPVSRILAVEAEREVARAGLAAIQEKVRQASDAEAITTLIRSRMKQLEVLPPGELRAVLKIATDRQLALAGRSAGAAGAKRFVLAARRETMMAADAWPGHTLLAATFGHYTYVRTADVTEATCRSEVPVKVRLFSLLPLLHISSPVYRKPFFFYAINNLKDFCETFISASGGAAVRVTYVFDNKVVATAKARLNARYDVDVSEVKLAIDPAIHPKEHADHVFDKAASAMLGGAPARYGQRIDALTIADLEALGRRGDLQAMTALGFDQVRDIAKGMPASRVLIFKLDRPSGINTEQLRRASDAGSAAASYVLAHSWASKNGLLSSIAVRGKDFYTLPAGERQAFLGWYAKARVGDVYEHRYLDQMLKRWSVPVEDVIAYVSKNGLSARVPTAIVSRQARGLSPGVARSAVNQYAMSKCNNVTKFFEAEFDNQVIAAIFGRYEVKGDACFFRYRGPYPYNIIQEIDGVELKSCRGGDTAKICDVIISVKCRFDTMTADPAAIRHQKMSLGAICLVHSVPHPARVNFVRNPDGSWSVAREIEFPGKKGRR